jgi:hypothetical protein
MKRSPKSEVRSPKEGRNPKSEGIISEPDRVSFGLRTSDFGLLSDFGFRISDFGFPSDFGFRISDFVRS